MSKSARVLTQQDVHDAAEDLARWISRNNKGPSDDPIVLHGVPRGGVPAAYLVARYLKYPMVVEDPSNADFIIDDIVDSGATMRRYNQKYPTATFRALFESPKEWLVFPWEGSAEGSADDIPRRLLQFIGEDPAREGLRDTPARFLRAWQEYTAGYRVPEAEFFKSLKAFDDGAERVDEMVVVRDIPVYSTCEHHLAPFFGSAHVAYIPKGRVVGLSKVARLVDYYARRLQVQERLTQQIAHALRIVAQCQDVGVVVNCRHMCMEARGIRCAGTSTTTSCMLGALRDTPSARAELLALVR